MYAAKLAQQTNENIQFMRVDFVIQADEVIRASSFNCEL